MLSFLGWSLILAGAFLAYRAWHARRAAIGAPRSPLLAAAACLAVGVALLIGNQVSAATLQPVDLSRPDDWIVGGPAAAIRIENGQLAAKLTVESESYAAFPVDWRGGGFRAEWEMTIKQLDLRPEWGERASIAVGLFDGSAANIDDADHVGGTAIEATFSDDVRLRASDEDRLLKTHSSTELSLSDRSRRRFAPSDPVLLQLNIPYHCLLTYDAGSAAADLTVTQGGRMVVTRRLEELPGYPPSVAWFGVTVRGFKHRNKQKEAALKTAYTKPAAEVVISRLRYKQSG